MPAFPWEGTEETFSELYHCYGASRFMVIDLTPGSGVAAVAAARKGINYLGFTRKPLHGDLVLETACSSVENVILLSMMSVTLELILLSS
jgi:alkyl hydroperoxide reductase subunit AhpF